MRIMTITRKLDATEEFDGAVNAALAAGWQLVKRDVLQSYEDDGFGCYLALYAELEKEG